MKEEMPAEIRDALSLEQQETTGHERPDELPSVVGDEADAQSGAIGNTWVLFGVFVLVAIGVVLLLIFASSGDASESMLL
ncbi:hypothetical protein [Salininema proteolyticum]|uniref:Uncharacterized protein n=1 Tax=Salininema proteolyticum TaxID=1607685 RepID=A0ABV8U115_9ACTN